MPDDYTNIGQQRWLRGVNDGIREIPPFAPVSIRQEDILPNILATSEAGELVLHLAWHEIESEHRFRIELPRLNLWAVDGIETISVSGIGFNSHLPLGPGKNGWFTMDTPAVARVVGGSSFGTSTNSPYLIPSYVSHPYGGEGLLRVPAPKAYRVSTLAVSSHVEGSVVFYDIGNEIGLNNSRKTLFGDRSKEHTIVRRFHYRTSTQADTAAG